MSRLSSLARALALDLDGAPAAFLWGPRKVGKSTLVARQFPKARLYDLLDTDEKGRLMLRPRLLREEVLAERPKVVVIDEVQKVPALLDEVHWLIENTKTKFILCGSSARKLRHGAANLLGGRAWTYELHPLTTHEVPGFDLERALLHGLVPAHYLGNHPERSLRSYHLEYLEQEVRSEALVRNVPAFARFLESVAFSHGALLNYANVARDCGVSPKTVREYYQILEDTLLGHTLEPWRKAKSRRLIETSKFYLFDVGVARHLRGLRKIEPGTAEFGKAFEHLLIQEVRAYNAYTERHAPLYFWRTSTGFEVDLIVGDMELAVEFKSSSNVREDAARGLRALEEDRKVRTALVVSMDQTPRVLEGGVRVVPWRDFCARLWAGEFF